MIENKSKNEKCSHKQEFNLQSRFINNHGTIITFDRIAKNGDVISIHKVCDLLNELHEENEVLKKENYKLHKRLGDFEPFEEYIKERTLKYL